MALTTTIQEIPELGERGPGLGGGDYIVIVFNNEHNTYSEVIGILMRATGCSLEEAQMETWEIDHLGKSVVHHSSQEECENVAVIIRTIGIQVDVRED